MAIIRSVKNTIQGADFYVAGPVAPGNSYPVGAATIRLPTGTASFSPPASTGKIRVKVGNAPTGTSQIGVITGTDGTTTVRLYDGDVAATTAGVQEELLREFLTDLNLTSITINATVGVATATVDAEIVYSS